ncbi:taste receptor type 2 member 1 [Echinops telfairi]|uniref:Taste receptor type 2 n=1 Tax=Echinops telfairi TaxID=9371 RepID=A0ABM0IES0_ECHTE|nr:taste receptor type 2 member 1 [Echinops telfairi]
MLGARLAYFLFSVLQLLTGVLANSLVVFGASRDWVKRRVYTSLDLLLSCLAVSRVLMQLLVFYFILMYLSFVEPSVSRGQFVLCMATNEIGLWLATWLGVFYCVKVANIAHPLFLWLKRKISTLVPWGILATLLYVLILCAGHLEYTWPLSKTILCHYFSQNATTVYTEPSFLSYTFVIMGLWPPLWIFLAAVLLLMVSLGRHARQMGRMAAGAGHPSRRAIAKALLSTLSFLVLYLSYYMVGSLLSSGRVQAGSLVVLFHTLIAGTYPSAHSIILLLGNAKLKQSVRLLLPRGRCCP